VPSGARRRFAYGAPVDTRPHRGQAWWMNALFMVGSACFALGAFQPFASAVAPNVVGAVFFVGSIFFTSAAFLAYLQTTGGKVRSWQPADLAWAAALIQLIGTSGSASTPQPPA
jgi:hypothetical protein